MLTALAKRLTAYLLLALFVAAAPMVILISWIALAYENAEAWANDAEMGDL